MRYVVLLGRIFYSSIFIMANLFHFSGQAVAHAAAEGVPMAGVLVPLSGIIGLVGGFSILLGYKAKWGAWLLVLFLVPITLMMHKFWAVADPQAAMRAMMASMPLRRVELRRVTLEDVFVSLVSESDSEDSARAAFRSPEAEAAEVSS